TVYSHYPEILNYFDNRSTNASAESFNAKLKAFRATLRGVNDASFFMYRVAKIYA
ncbi:MAG: transposase, partial [Salinivirgaceae bacterium]|nr:transposase [Salinivirgaceae bacterium]